MTAVKSIYIRRSKNRYGGLFVSGGLLVAGIIIGISGYMFIEGYTLHEAFYMTIITLSTVGFTEVKPLSENGEVFTSFLIIFNIGIFAYAITTVSKFVVEGGLLNIYSRRKVFKLINQLSDHVIICGYGRYGREIAHNFMQHNQPFVVIEQDEEAVERINDENILCIYGDATDDDILIRAGINNAKSLISSLPEDTDNLYVVLTARQLNKDLNIISRATLVKSPKKLKRAGADHVILPNQIGGLYMAALVTKPDAVEFFTVVNESGQELVTFEEVIIDSLAGEIENKSIIEINIRQKTGANVIGIRTPDDQYIVNPDPGTLIEKGMRIIVLGTNEQVMRFKSYMNEIYTH